MRGAFFSFHKMDRASFARSLPSIRDTIVRSFVKRGIAIPTTGNEITKLTLVGYTIIQLVNPVTLRNYGSMAKAMMNPGGLPYERGADVRRKF